MWPWKPRRRIPTISEREAEKEEVLDSILCCVEIECLESKFYVFFLISKEIDYSITLQVTVFSR